VNWKGGIGGGKVRFSASVHGFILLFSKQEAELLGEKVFRCRTLVMFKGAGFDFLYLRK